MKIRVVPEARSLDGDAVRGAPVVVIDTLRATTTIAHAVARGAAVEPVRSIAEARRRRGARVLIAGERGGAKLAGFDLGNSPVEIDAAPLTGRRLVLTTTNGTLAVQRAAAARALYAGALVNAAAVARALPRDAEALYLVCAGRTTGVALEDLCAAGAVLDALLGRDADPVPLTDGARLSLELFRRERGRLPAFLAECESGRNLARLGMSADLAACARLDALDVAPRLRRGRFVA